MSPVEELRAGMDYVRACLQEMHGAAEGRNLEDDEQGRWDEGMAFIADAERQLERHAEVERLARIPAAVETGDFQFQRTVEPFDGLDVRTMTRGEARDRARKVLESRDHVDHLSTRQVEHLDRLMRTQSRNIDGSYIAKRLLLTESEAYQRAFMKVMSKPNAVLTPDEARAMTVFEEFRAMSIGTDSAGGFGVPVIIDPTIILDAQGSSNPMLRISRIETITNDEWKGVSSAGVTWSFDAEAAAVSDDSPTLAQPNVPTHKAQGFIPFSIEVGMDYPNFAGEMSTLLSEGYSELLAEKLITGSGTGEPTGIEDALDANTNVEVTPTTDGAFGAVDLGKVWAELPERYRPNATWLSSTDVQNEVRFFGDNLGGKFTVDLTAGVIERLFARPYALSDFLPDFTGTTGASNILIVGDFRNYLVAQRAGMSVELVPHIFADAAGSRPTGQRGWYAWARVGGDSINDKGFRLLQNQ